MNVQVKDNNLLFLIDINIAMISKYHQCYYPVFIILFSILTSISSLFAIDASSDATDSGTKNNIGPNTFQVIADIKLNNIEREGSMHVVAFVNGQYFTEDIKLTEIKNTNKKNLIVIFNVEKTTKLVSAKPLDDYFVCVYHVKDSEKSEDSESAGNSFIYFDCKQGKLLSTSGPTKLQLFKSLKTYAKSKILYDLSVKDESIDPFFDSNPNDPILEKTVEEPIDDKIVIEAKISVMDRKQTEELMVIAMTKGEIMAEEIEDIQSDLEKQQEELEELVEDGVPTDLDKQQAASQLIKTFTFDRETDVGTIEIGDKFFVCVSGENLNASKNTQCANKSIKKLGVDSSNKLSVP